MEGRTREARLLFDENLSPRVAEALRVLGLGVHWLGYAQGGEPSRGSSDRVVLEHAKQRRQTIVTANLDMVMLCSSERESLVWLDARGRQLRRTEQVVLVFTQVEGWNDELQLATEPVCIQAHRTTPTTLPLAEAGRRAHQRFRRIQARERRRRPGRQAVRDQLLLDLD